MSGNEARAARVLAVGCPDWPVVATAPAGGDAPGEPVAVVGGAARESTAASRAGQVVPRRSPETAAGQVVVACSAAARAEGVRRGQRLRDAQRRCPDLVVRADDPEGQARLFEQVVAAVEQLCPRIEVVRPGLLALPARGPARYFGGERALADRVRQAVAARGFGCCTGIADGLFAAVLAARAGDAGVVVAADRTAAFLADHPVQVLDRPELSGLLVRLGIRTLGAYAALPAGDVLARFGTDAAIAHRHARGLEPRPPAPRPPGRDLTVRCAFDPPLEQFERAVFSAKSLADELHDTLAELGLSCVRVEVEVTTEDGRQWSRLWRHDGLLSAAAVAERVRWQLEAWRTDTGAGTPDAAPDGTAGEEALTGGLVLLRLRPDQLVPDDRRQLALWGRGAEDDRVGRAATRVQALLGHGAVTRPLPVGGRGPGERVVAVPWGDLADPGTASPGGAAGTAAPPVEGGWPGRVLPPLPTVVPPSPVPARLVDATGANVTVSGRGAVSAPPARLAVRAGAGGGADRPVTGWTGPWPATEHWWDQDRRRRLARFQVVTDDGRAWLLLLEDGGWYVEAGYA